MTNHINNLKIDQSNKRSALEMLTKLNANGVDTAGVSRSSNRANVLTASDVAACMAGLTPLQVEYVKLILEHPLDYAAFEVHFLMKALLEEEGLHIYPFVTLQKALKAAVVIDIGGAWCGSCHGTGRLSSGKSCPSCAGAGHSFKYAEVARRAGIERRIWEKKTFKPVLEEVKRLLLVMRLDVEAHLSKKLGWH